MTEMIMKVLHVVDENNNDLELYINDQNEVYLSIEERQGDYPLQWIVMDKQDAIALRDELDRLIKEME